MARVTLVFAAVGALLSTACAEDPRPECPPGCLSPVEFDSEAWVEAWRTFDRWEVPEAATRSTRGMVVDASVAPSALAGAAALEAGGSAVDAALTAALTTVVAGMGAPVSLTGVSALVYYDAASGQTHFLDGGWQTVAGEEDLASAPSDAPSGRNILVSGFMAAVDAAHQRFGRLPYRALFEPAIHVAEEGFVLPESLARMVSRNQEVLGRRPETRAVFTRPGGGWIQEGDVFRQPALAETLRRLATEGASYMYQGPWARKLVEAVREDGGHLTLEDLASYEAEWGATDRARYGEHEIHVPGGNAAGGTTLIQAMHLLDRAGVRDHGPVGESAESLYWMSRVGYLLWVGDFRDEEFRESFPELAHDPAGRRTPEHADQLWEVMQTPRWEEFVASDPFSGSAAAPPAHTDAIVAVDQWGNVAALIFTSNVMGWGHTGIFVDGVSVPDAGTLGLVRNHPGLAPGTRVSNWLNPTLVLREGRPVLASAALGAGIHHATVQTLMNVLDFEMDAVEAVQAPQAVHFAWPGAPGVPPGTPIHAHIVEEGRIPGAVLDSVRSRGQPVVEVPAAAAYSLMGALSLVTIDGSDGTVTGLANTGGHAAAPGSIRR